MNIQEGLKKVAEDLDCSLEDLAKDPHSAADGLVELGVFTEDEAWSELGFATICEALGVPGGY